MDPLSVAASVAGLLKGAHELSNILGPYISAAKEAPPIAHRVHSELQNTKIILSAVQTLTKNLTSANVKNASLIQVDQVVAVLTDGVLIFSELELACGVLRDEQPSALRLRSRLNLVRKEDNLSSLLTRLQAFKDSLTLMLTILQSDSDFRAEQDRARLSKNIKILLESDRGLSQRLMKLEDAFDVQSLVARRQSLASSISPQSNDPQISTSDVQYSESSVASSLSRLSLTPDQSLITSSEFQSDLEASRVYRRAKRRTMDFSFRSSITGFNAWSVFSGLSLGDVSVMSVIALPVYAHDISNPQHYDFDGDSKGQDNTPQPLQPRKEEHSRSFFHDCLELKLSLTQITGFTELFDEVRRLQSTPDPLSELRAVFRRGFPLLMLLNEIQYQWDAGLFSRGDSYEQLMITMGEFTRGCTNLLGLDAANIFTTDELMSLDILVSLKVIALLRLIVGRVSYIKPIDATISSHSDNDPPASVPEQDGMILEFLATERAYYTEIQKAAAVKRKLDNELRWSAVVLNVFGPLSRLIESQLRLLYDLEVVNSRRPLEQDWARPFYSWESKASQCYIALAAQEDRRRAALMDAKSREACDDTNLVSNLEAGIQFLCLPYLRLQQYHEFLKGVESTQEGGDNLAADMVGALIQQIDKARQKVYLDDRLHDLKKRVIDWRGHKPNQFGDLLLFGNLPVSSATRTQKYHVYLFQKIFLACSVVQKNRSARTLMKGIFNSSSAKPEPAAVSTGEEVTNLSIRGRVFVLNIVEVNPIIESNSFACEMIWKGGDKNEKMVIRLPSHADLETWTSELRGLLA